MSTDNVPVKDFNLWKDVCLGNLDQIEKHLTAGANINSQCPGDLRTPLHLAVESGREQTIMKLITINELTMKKDLKYHLKNVEYETAAELAIRKEMEDVGLKLIMAEFKGSDDAEAFYQLMKRRSIKALDLLIKNREVGEKSPKENLAKAWMRLQTEQFEISPEMENYVHLVILRFEWEAINAKAESPKTKAANEKSVKDALLAGINQLVEKHEQGGNLCHDVDNEFLEMLRAILKLLDALKDIKSFPVYKLKYCVAIYLAIYDKKPHFNMYHLVINKIIIVDFLKEFRYAILTDVQHSGSRPTLPVTITRVNTKGLGPMMEGKRTIEELHSDSDVPMESCKKKVKHSNFQAFDTLFEVFSYLKNLYSLTKMKNQLEILEKIRSDTKTSSYVMILGILRTMQIIAEVFKPTSGTSKISNKLHLLLLNTTPVLNTISKMQKFLSHNFSDQKYSFYKETSKNKHDATLYLHYADDFLKLKKPVEEAYARTILNTFILFLKQILKSDSKEMVHTICKVFDIQPGLREHFNLNIPFLQDKPFVDFIKKLTDEFIFPCINLLLMMNDLEELKQISRFYLRSLSFRSVLQCDPSFIEQEQIFSCTTDDKTLGEDTFFEETSDRFKVLQNTININKLDEEPVLTSDYLRNEVEVQLSELNLLNDESFDEFINQLNPYFNNVLNIEMKYSLIRTVCESYKVRIDEEQVKTMREKDMKNLDTLIKQLFQDMANIIPVENEMTVVEMASIVTSMEICEVKIAAIEMIMLDALEILIDRNILIEYPATLVTSARPVISGHFLRNSLAHDSLIYDSIFRYSAKPHTTILLNAICLFQYLQVSYSNSPEKNIPSEADETESLMFETLVGNLPEQGREPNEQVKDLILHAISTKDEKTAKKLINQLEFCKPDPPIASFLLPAVTQRMNDLVEHICKLDPENIDFVNSDQKTALYRAVEVDCQEYVTKFLQLNAKPHRKPHSPLLRALELQRNEIFNTLVSFRKTFDEDDSLQIEVLRAAATYDRVDLLRKFESVIKNSKSIRSLLCFAIKHDSLQCARYLLKNYSYLATVNVFTYTCHFRSYGMVNHLMSHLADVTIKSNLLYAVIEHTPIFEALITKMKVSEETKGELFQFCLLARKPKLAREVLKAGHSFGRILSKNDWNGVKGWLPEMCDLKPNIIDGIDAYVLGLAILDGESTFVEKVFSKVCKNFSKHDHARLLNCAIRKQDFKMVDYLTENKCNVNCADASGLTPLGMALSLKRTYFDEGKLNEEETFENTCKPEKPFKVTEMINFILSKGADINMKTGLFSQTYDSCLLRDEDLQGCVKFFEYPISIAAFQGYEELLTSFVKNNKEVSVNVYSDDGKSLLIKCVERGLFKITDKLIDLGADIDYARKFTYPDGGSVLHFLVKNHKFKIYEHLVAKHSFDKNLTDSKGNTVLHQAVICQNLEIVKYFKRNNRLWATPNKDGRTPVQLAHYCLNRYQPERFFEKLGLKVNAPKK